MENRDMRDITSVRYFTERFTARPQFRTTSGPIGVTPFAGGFAARISIRQAPVPSS